MKRLSLVHQSTARKGCASQALAERCTSCAVRAIAYCVAAAGTPEEASARRWLKAQGGAVTCLYGLDIEGEREADGPGRDLDAARLSALLASLPALTSIDCLDLRADLHRGPTAAAAQAFLAAAARAMGRCWGLQRLSLCVTLAGGLAGQLPEALALELAGARSLSHVHLTFKAVRADRRDWPVIPSLAHLVAGLAGLSRLRTLVLALYNVSMEATLPASVSCLAQLTSLSLCGFHGLRCAPGWARLPALAHLEFTDCVFAGDGEAALPGMDALGALASLFLHRCPSLRVLPASLWRLPRLRYVHHLGGRGEVADAALVPGPPLGAPCSASMLGLSHHSLPVFPPGILGMRRLKRLDLSHSCFGRLPEGVSALTCLETLLLGRHAASMEVGGAFDARALGSLAGLPYLRELGFANCRVLFCSDFQAAAAHPRLQRLVLDTSHPAPGPSCMALLGFVHALLQRRRPDMLELNGGVVDGAARQDSRDFLAALRAVGYPLSEAESLDLV